MRFKMSAKWLPAPNLQVVLMYYFLFKCIWYTDSTIVISNQWCSPASGLVDFHSEYTSTYPQDIWLTFHDVAKRHIWYSPINKIKQIWMTLDITMSLSSCLFSCANRSNMSACLWIKARKYIRDDCIFKVKSNTCDLVRVYTFVGTIHPRVLCNI